jgi:3-hydroxybutyryl-CoA dehydrogenase
MQINKVLVVGAGQMGSGIAQVCAQAGLQVVLLDIKEEFVEKGLKGIAKNLQRGVDKGRISAAEKEAALSLLQGTLKMEVGSDADMLIEAVAEVMTLKKKIFTEADRILPPHAILATNTSSLPITEIAAVTERPTQVIGMHFMNPVPVMKLVEIIRGIATSSETFNVTRELALKLGKTPVEVNDFPGFVSNRVLLPMINEAVYCLMEGVAEAEAIDTVLKLGMNHPMGPLALADLIGLDTCLSIMEVLHDGLGDSKYRPCPLLRKYVHAGWLGVKTGRGFYQYDQ